MSVSENDIKTAAELAKIQLSEDEISSYTDDLNNIIEYLDVISEADTEGVEPLIQPIELKMRLRKDIAGEPLPHEDALKNAPDADSDYFRVPKVIE